MLSVASCRARRRISEKIWQILLYISKQTNIPGIVKWLLSANTHIVHWTFATFDYEPFGAHLENFKINVAK